FDISAGYQYIDIDITDELKWKDLITNQKPNVVVHGAAITQPDDCELNQAACYDTNVKGTPHLLSAAVAGNCYFIYISSDFVFDGAIGNYAEDDKPNPVSWYGQTKLQAEELVRNSSLSWAIARTCLVYGNVLQGTRSNIIAWVKHSLENGKKIKVVSDQR